MTEHKVKSITEAVERAREHAVAEALRLAELNMTPAQVIRSTGIHFEKADPSWDDAIFVLAYAGRHASEELPKAMFKRKSDTSLPAHRFSDALQDDAKPEPTKRRMCLGGCGETFESTHAGNRICPRCTARNRRLSSAIA